MEHPVREFIIDFLVGIGFYVLVFCGVKKLIDRKLK